jgi:hypothetical protein
MMKVFKANLGALAVCAAMPTLGWAASAQVHGQGALVGEYDANMVPSSATWQGFRLPFGLTFEGRASNNLSLFLDIRYTVNRSPDVASSLGDDASDKYSLAASNSGAKSTPSKTDRGQINQPFAIEGGRGEKSSLPIIGFAYMQYASEVGLFKAGRVPRHWGLGLWRNAEWKPEGGTISTTDSISGTFDLTSSFSGSVYYEKLAEGNSTSAADDADAFTVEALLADDPSDVSASGVTRQIGVSFSSYEHKLTSTRIRTLDLFSKIHAGSLGIEGELVFPSYANMGGSADQCPVQKNPEELAVACDSQRFEGLAALFRMKYLFAGTASGPEGGLSLGSVEAARARLNTSLRSDSHTLGFWAGYARGDSDAFEGTGKKDGTIRTTPFHPNVRPALLMYGLTQKYVPGMPGNAVANTIFTRFDYTFESPGFGAISPALVWGRLEQSNNKPTVAGVGYGRNKNLGFEMDLGYSYTTVDNLKIGLDSGVWFPGAAWALEGNSQPSATYGLRTSFSTSF